MSSESIVLNLQQRVAYMENALSFLSNEVQRLSQGHAPVSQGFQTSIPLQPIQGRRPYVPRPQGVTTISHASHPSHASQTQTRPYSQPRTQQEEAPAPIALSEILQTNEAVTFGIHTGRDVTGNLTTSTVLATFDGTDLTVTECAAVASIVGLKTSKPGEILFKFMAALKEAGILQRTFNALPWRLASVQRDGQRLTLAQLRREKQGGDE